VPLIADYANLMTGQKQQTEKSRRRRRSAEDPNYSDEEEEDLLDMIRNRPDEFMKKVTDPSFEFTMKQYCSIVKKLKFGCTAENPLEMWTSDQSQNFTVEGILHKINTIKINQVTGHEANFSSLLSGIERDANGKIVSAKSILTNFHLHLNFSEVDLNRVGNAAGTEEWTTVNIMRFEEKFLLLMERLKVELESEGIKILYGSGRSYGDISSKTLFQDIDKLSLGIVLMSIYIILILSKFSWPETRLHLTGMGILNVGMAFLSEL
jgi:Niemann-Pick C1 protein